MIKKKYIEIVFLIILGSISSLSLPPYNYFIINFFTFSAFFIFLFKKSKIIQSKKHFFFYGWIFGFGYFLSSLYWISISLTFDENFKEKVVKTFIHGYLHLLGFDHIKDKDYRKMLSEEEKIYKSVISKIN